MNLTASRTEMSITSGACLYCRVRGSDYHHAVYLCKFVKAISIKVRENHSIGGDGCCYRYPNPNVHELADAVISLYRIIIRTVRLETI
jgi:hypothetical protein